MAAKILRSLAVSAFCEDMAMMLAAGIQVDDALSLMRGDSGDGPLYDAASAVLERVQMGEPLAEAVEQCGYFPAYAAQLVAAGEAAGRTESVLKSLAVYYETQDKLEKRGICGNRWFSIRKRVVGECSLCEKRWFSIESHLFLCYTQLIKSIRKKVVLNLPRYPK